MKSYCILCHVGGTCTLNTLLLTFKECVGGTVSKDLNLAGDKSLSHNGFFTPFSAIFRIAGCN